MPFEKEGDQEWQRLFALDLAERLQKARERLAEAERIQARWPEPPPGPPRSPPTPSDAEAPDVAQQLEEERKATLAHNERMQRQTEEHAQRMANEELLGVTETRLSRRVLSKLFFGLCCAWMGFVLVMVFLAGLPEAGWHLTTSDKVLMMMLGSTTANVLGLLYIMARHFFPDGGTPRRRRTDRAEGA